MLYFSGKCTRALERIKFLFCAGQNSASNLDLKGGIGRVLFMSFCLIKPITYHLFGNHSKIELGKYFLVVFIRNFGVIFHWQDLGIKIYFHYNKRLTGFTAYKRTQLISNEVISLKNTGKKLRYCFRLFSACRKLFVDL